LSWEPRLAAKRLEPVETLLQLGIITTEFIDLLGQMVSFLDPAAGLGYRFQRPAGTTPNSAVQVALGKVTQGREPLGCPQSLRRPSEA